MRFDPYGKIRVYPFVIKNSVCGKSASSASIRLFIKNTLTIPHHVFFRRRRLFFPDGVPGGVAARKVFVSAAWRVCSPKRRARKP